MVLLTLEFVITEPSTGLVTLDTVFFRSWNICLTYTLVSPLFPETNSTRRGSASFHAGSWIENVGGKFYLFPDDSLFSRQMRDYLSGFQEQCDAILNDVNSALQHLESLQKQYLFVSTKTGTLHEACEQLLKEQVSFGGKVTGSFWCTINQRFSSLGWGDLWAMVTIPPFALDHLFSVTAAVRVSSFVQWYVEYVLTVTSIKKGS